MRPAVAAMLLAALPLRAAELKSIIVADHETKRVIHIKPDGTLIWDAPNNNGHDVQLLPNGNLLINNPPAVQEVDKDKKVVWEVGKPAIQSAESCQRLANGHTIIADVGRMKVVEFDKDKKPVWEFAVPNDNKRPRPTMRQVRRLDNGNTLICASTEDKVIEVSPDKKVVWSYALPFPYLATRLPGGNTLISSAHLQRRGLRQPEGLLRDRGRPGRQDGLEVRRRGRAGRGADGLAERLRAAQERQHADLGRARQARLDPRGDAGQEDRPRHHQPGDETPLHPRRD
jgi:hypothetical protein